jgi:predicted Zn finger-like uncharacterized protein
MSLATRCAKCGTVFRVVQDQLEVSQGWVRCGRCGDVFNALEGLFDLEGTSGPMPLARDTPPIATPAPQPAAPIVAAQNEEPAQVSPTSQIDRQADGRGESGFGRSRPRSRFDDVDLVDSVVPHDAVSAARESEPAANFLREAERVEQWQRPRVRRSLWLLSLLLVAVLATQVALQQRVALVARWPTATPVLAALCATLGCTIEAPRALDAMAVESSGLTRVDGAPLYRLQVTLRNRSSLEVLAPALDITLTDMRGDVVARRVLRATDVGAPALGPLAAGAEWPINAVLDLGDVRVAGYTVELFYP